MKDQCAELRRQILEDVLGDSVDEYENFDKSAPHDSRRQHRQRIPLWQFLLHLLNRDVNSNFIEWSKDRVLEFRIKDTMAIADLWGSVKNKTDMTYEKLGRAMRYYYGKSIIEKVSGRRYTYRFILSRRTKKYLSEFTNAPGAKIDSIQNEENKSDNDDIVVPDSRPGSVDISESDTPPSPISPTSPTPTPPPPLSAIKTKREKPMPLKIKPVKPTPQQTVMKTKIFKPEDLIRKSVNLQPSSSYNVPLLSERKANLFSFSGERRSAFFKPSKSKMAERIRGNSIYQDMPILERIHAKSNDSPPVKRKFQDQKTKFTYGPAHVSVYYETEEPGSGNESCGRESPQELNTNESIGDLNGCSVYCHANGDEFIIRNDNSINFREKHQRGLIELQHKLKLNHRRTDPFMGMSYDYVRYDADAVTHEPLYETLDDYICEQEHRRHAWAA